MPQSSKPETQAASGKRYTLEQLAAMSDIEQAKYLDSLPLAEKADLMADSLVHGLNAKVLQDHPTPPPPSVAPSERLGKRAFKLLGSGRFRIVARDEDLPIHLQHPEGDVRGVYDPKTNTPARAALRALPVGIP